jgi:hypothetical protein
MEDNDLYDERKVTAEVGKVCDLMKADGLTMIEQWGVSRSIMVAAASIMAEGHREVLERLASDLKRDLRMS